VSRSCSIHLDSSGFELMMFCKVNLRVNGVLYGCVLDSMRGETKCVLWLRF
jgi:hypothetical protein